MFDDPIVEEVRRIRRDHSKRYNNSLAQICLALKEREAQSERQVVNRGPRRRLSKTGS